MFKRWICRKLGLVTIEEHRKILLDKLIKEYDTLNMFIPSKEKCEYCGLKTWILGYGEGLKGRNNK